jgi:hypothetical protein
MPYSTKAAPSSSWRNRLIKLPMGEIHSYLRRRPRVDRLAQQEILLTMISEGNIRLKKFRAHGAPAPFGVCINAGRLRGRYGRGRTRALGWSFRNV